MIPNTGREIFLSTGEGADLTPSPKSFLRTLIFVSRHGAISGAIEAAIEREFPWISVRCVPELRQVCNRFDEDPQLILIDIRLIHDLSELYMDISRQHPHAHLAILVDGDARISPGQMRAIDTGLVHGILPLNVNLDVLLSILRILLKGGECFPSAVVQAHNHVTQNDPVELRSPGDGSPFGVVAKRRDSEAAILDLTGREREILSAVARGRQNKIIAADLGLSEHTVKLHIHNIITKLGVHNRTEAAVLYLERSNSAVVSASLATIDAAGPTGVSP
jgi:DNA-binding NarL/FixJ family response regulator